MSYERLYSNETFFAKVIEQYLENKESIYMHNHFVSLVQQTKHCLYNITQSPRQATLAVFLANNMPTLEKHTELIWDNFSTARRAVPQEDIKLSERLVSSYTHPYKYKS